VPVNSRRRSARADKAQATRRRILEAARELFCADGYATTRIEEIAEAAGVAVQTVYFVFGNKRTVLKEVVDLCCRGEDDPVPPLERAWVRKVAATSDPAEQLSMAVRHLRRIHERVSPVLEVLRQAATTDPEIEELWQQNKRHRFEVHRHIVGLLAAGEALRPGLSEQQATDIAYGVMGQELFAVLVVERGWTTARWARWVHGVLSVELLGRPVAPPVRATR
jgi:AcrR family transcriptional regulator